jgi:hypothetical protein
MRGTVVDATTASSTTPKVIAGAYVVARDDNGAAITNIAVTDDKGVYSLVVPAPRDANGGILPIKYTLRADAPAYETFPSGLRVALPIDVTTATGSPPIIENPTTRIGLYPLQNAVGLGSISGAVRVDHAGGTLVVAESTGAHASAIADKSGKYMIFNLPAASYEVRGYAAGLNLNPAMASVTQSTETKGVDLVAGSGSLGAVNGTVSIVNAPGGSTTSVVLAVESTFNDVLGRGEVPRGLRVANVSGAFSIPDVPSGRYVVLAAFENDLLVRDPDTSIGNTATLHVTVAGAPLDAGNFKITEALAVVGPGAVQVEQAASPVTFVWQDDSSEDAYTLEVFDNFGAQTWTSQVPSVSGSGNVSMVYGGPALVPGNYYQFRATSLHGGVPISRTEDLLGVFIAQ